MTPYYPDFFNDVFGPVMQPGSSSHMAGPCRLGYLARRLLRQPLRHICVELDRNGSYAGTFGLMNEDLGMLAGAYGLLPDDARLFDIRGILKREAISWAFRFVDFPRDAHPNAARFLLTGTAGETAALSGSSTGGGRILVTEVQGVPCRFLGDGWLACLRENGQLRLSLTDEAPAPDAAQVFVLPPVLPVAAPSVRRPQLYGSFAAWRAWAEAHGRTLPQAAVEYERRASGWTEADILDAMEVLRRRMERQTEAVYTDDSALLATPFSGYHYGAWRQYESARTPLSGPVMARAVHYAFGVQAQQRDILQVPGPMGTGGGYLYAALRAAAEAGGFSRAAVLDGLLTAAGVGAIAYTRTDPTGELLGCAGECGVCGAMAAAAITQAAGGTAAQVESAASLVLQASLGWPCDPIPGGGNQPCMSRVLTAVVMAIVFADAALSGREAVVPFDQVLDTADALGRQMPPSLKCTACGGLCTTPAGLERRHAFEAWRREAGV